MAAVRGNTVSVVIPTRNRAEMAMAAVRSALAEPVAEVIVVIDGAEYPASPSTIAALTAIEDPRLRVTALPRSVGGSEARNTGVRAASGDWVAFLDDDDLWLPGKIPAQLRLAAAMEADSPVISCAVIARSPAGDRAWPRRLYRASEPMSEYLFCRSGWTCGAALLQTSTLLAPRDLLTRVPFAVGLKKHQDWDWLLRVEAEHGVAIAMAPEPLVIFHVEGHRPSVGRSADWEFSYRWATENRRFFTPRSFASFLATECAPQAARAGVSLKERARLVGLLFREGAPTLKTLILCVGFLLVPQGARRAVRDAFRAGRFGPARPEVLP